METLSIPMALTILGHYANQGKRTYVKMRDRAALDGTSYIVPDAGLSVRLHVNVYSKTWSKVSMEWRDDQGVNVRTQDAHRYLIEAELLAEMAGGIAL